MSDERPDPLTPPDCDLRSQDWMALKFKQLRDSDFWLSASDAVKVISLELWCAAYEQVPAGSLPDRDDRLAQLAGFGQRGVNEWRLVRTNVLSAWTLCGDGRWYHPTVCEVALDGWILKLKDRSRKTGDAGKRAKTRLPIAREFRRRLAERRGFSTDAAESSADNDENSTENDDNSSVTGQDRTGQDRTGKEIDLFQADELAEASGKKPGTDLPDQSKTAKGLDPELSLPDAWSLEAQEKGKLEPAEITQEWESFRDFWLPIKHLKKGKKHDWRRTWINYVTGDICQNRIGARRRNARAGGKNEGAASLIERTAQRYR